MSSVLIILPDGKNAIACEDFEFAGKVLAMAVRGSTGEDTGGGAALMEQILANNNSARVGVIETEHLFNWKYELFNDISGVRATIAERGLYEVL